MKTRLLIISAIAGAIILGSGTYVYSQMYDCLNPPPWMKVPFFGFEKCFQLFINGNLPDWTQAKEDHEKEQTMRIKLIERFKDQPEVVAFYSNYGDGNVSIRDDRVSYFAGSEDGFFVRMNLYFDKNYDLDYMDFHCYYQNEHQYEIPQEDIASKIAEYDCKEHERFEGPESTITEDETISENSVPYTTYDVSGFKKIYNIGEPISFTETIQGFSNPCISTHYEILDGNTLESVWDYKIVYPCPYIRDPQQFKKITTIPNESISSPILNQTGRYIFHSYHSYSDEYTVVKFSVIDDSSNMLNKTSETTVKWKKYITVSASRIDESPLPDMLKIQHVKELSENKILTQLISGANGCKDETEMCSLPSGISIDR